MRCRVWWGVSESGRRQRENRKGVGLAEVSLRDYREVRTRFVYKMANWDVLLA
jgi:hypothetical protein